MAPARFAPTGGRLGQQPTVLGDPAPQYNLGTPLQSGGNLGRPLTPRFVPQQSRADQAISQAITQNPELKRIFGQITGEYKRPRSALDTVFRALRVGENIGVGIAKTFTELGRDVAEDFDFDAQTLKDIYDFTPSWALVNAATGGEAYREIPAAVKDDMTYEEWITESTDPKSFWYKNAAVIGFGLSIVGDPTTYLTFGTTGVSKAAAQKLVVDAWQSSYDEAFSASLNGVTKSGQSVAAGADIDKLAVLHHLDAKRPFTVGDGLELLRVVDKSSGSAFRKMFPRGGRGIRMMGAEVPGSREAGGLIAKGITRGRTDELMTSMDKVGSNLTAFIPDGKLLAIADDVSRAVAMQSFSDMRKISAHVAARHGEDAAQIGAVDPAKVDWWQQKPAFQRAVSSIFGIGAKPEYIPPHARKGLLQNSSATLKNAGEWRGKLNSMNMEIGRRRKSMMAQAADLGVDTDQLDEMWTKMVQDFDDPVEAFARFTMHTQGRIVTNAALDGMLQNPMIARVLDKEAEAVGGFYEDVAKLVDKRADLTDRLKNKKLNKGLRTRYMNQIANLNPQIKAANAALDTAKETQKLSKGKAGGRLTTEAGFRQVFKQDGMPFSHRGSTYLVSAPVHEALTNMRNPKHVDAELNKAFRVMNFTQNKWKMLATTPNPAFHVMNLVGGMWNNMLGGVYLHDHVAAAMDVWRVRADRVGKEGRTIAGVTMPAVGPKVPGLNKMFQAPDATARAIQDFAAFEARGTAGGLVKQELKGGAKLAKSGADRGPKRKAFTAARRTAALATIGVVGAEQVMPDDWLPDEITGPANVLTAALLGAPEVVAVGRKVANDVEEVLRFAPFRKYAHDPTIRQVLAANSISPPVNFGKYMGLSANQQELMYDLASSISLKFQFDYTDLTHIERYFAKTVFPFYTFHKNNFILQATELAKRPRILATVDKVMRFSESMSEDEDNAWFQNFLPEYFDKIGMFQVPVPGFARDILGLPKDQDLFLNPKLPYASLNLIPPLWELANDDSVTPPFERFLQVFSPITGMIGPFSLAAGPIAPKVLLEYSMGYQLGLARPIDYQRFQSGGFRQSAVDAPGFTHYLPGPLKGWLGIYDDPRTGVPKMNASMKYIVEQMASPFINGLGNTVQAGGPDTENRKADTVAYMTGLRMTPVDPLRLQRGWLYRMRTYLEAEKSNARQRGEQFPTDDDYLLSSIRAQLEVVEAAWDEQQAQLYQNG